MNCIKHSDMQDFWDGFWVGIWYEAITFLECILHTYQDDADDGNNDNDFNWTVGGV